VPVSRRFLIAPPLARLVHKEFAPARLTEGHFAPHAERHTHVRLDSGQASLVLTTLGAHPETAEEITHLPSVHAEALLNVCPGTLVIERSAVPLGTMHAFVDRFILPGPMDLVSVDFATSVEANRFQPPVWFGLEVSADDSFSNREIALSGVPPVQDAEVSNIALEAVLDVVERAAVSTEDIAPAAHNQLAGHAALPKVSAFDLHVSDHRDARDEDMATVIHSLAATLAEAAPAMNGASIKPSPQRGWLPGPQ
jgi:CYTH domain-containing protein